jgi:MFS family permease
MESDMLKVMKFSIIKNRNFKLITAGQFVSAYGDSLYAATILWIAAEMTNSTVQLSIIGICETLPAIVLGVFSGTIVDKFLKTRIMILSDFARALCILIVFLLYITSELNIYYIFAVTLVLGIFHSIYNPAQFAIIPEIVKEEEIQQANSVNTIMLNISNMAGSSSSGFIYRFLGVPISILINITSYIVSGICTIFVKPAKIIKTENTVFNIHTVFADTVGGLKYIMGKPVLISCMLLSMTINILSGALILVPLYIKNDLNMSITIFGLAEGFGAAGMVFGAWLLANIKIKKTYEALFLSGFLQAVSFLVIAIIPNPIILIAFRGIYGLFNGTLNVLFVTKFQSEIDEEYLGRVYSVSYIIGTVSLPLAAVMCGFVADFFGIARAWSILSILVGLLVLINYIFHYRNYRKINNL